MKTLFIANPRSGASRARRVPIQDRLARANQGSGLEAEIVVTEGSGHARALAAEAVAAGLHLVVAVGGDGTANEVASALAATGCALGVIPIGSGNGFARDRGMSLDPARACRQIARGTTRALDLGVADGRVFLMCAGLGLDARVIHRFHCLAGDRRGLLPYVAITLDEGVRQRRLSLSIEADGVERRVEPLLFMAVNTRMIGMGAVVAPGASAEDGLIDFVMVEPLSALRALVYGARLFSDRFDSGSRVEIVRAARLVVRAEHELVAQVDGEPALLAARVEFGCRPRAILFRGPE